MTAPNPTYAIAYRHEIYKCALETPCGECREPAQVLVYVEDDERPNNALCLACFNSVLAVLRLEPLIGVSPSHEHRARYSMMPKDV